MYKLLFLSSDPAICLFWKENLSQENKIINLKVKAACTLVEAMQYVKESAERSEVFDIILTDYNSSDSIDIMSAARALRRLSSTSIFINIKEVDESEQNSLISEVEYTIHKPTTIDKVLYSIRTAVSERIHNEWLKIFIDIAERTQKCHYFQEVATEIVEGALKLGFERVRLFWAMDDVEPGFLPTHLVGIHQAGLAPIDGFRGRRLAVSESPYTQEAIESHNALLYTNRIKGPGFLEKVFRENFRPSKGQWVLLPLWVRDQFMGDIVFDNVEHEIVISQHQVELLNLFARQVASILDRALQDIPDGTKKEKDVRNQVEKVIRSQSVLGELDNMLKAIWGQVNMLMNANNFQIVLYIPETKQLDYRLDYHNNRFHPSKQVPLNEGDLATKVICSGIKERGTGTNNKRLVVPLIVDRNAIGAFIINSDTLKVENERMLEAIANQVAGTIQIARMKEEEKERADRMKAISRANLELLNLAETDKLKFLKLMLIGVTDKHCFKFNHAILFTYFSDTRMLKGELGAGEIDATEAHRQWETDEHQNLTFEEIIEALHRDQLRSSALEQLAPDLSIEVTNDSVFDTLVKTGKYQVLTAEEVNSFFPNNFLVMFNPGECALLPYGHGKKFTGMLLVDNKFDGKPIKDLDPLEIFLTSSVVTWENHLFRERHMELLKVTQKIASQAGKGALREVLNQICTLAIEFTGAAFAIIYPVEQGGSVYRYKLDQIGYAGNAIKPKLKDKPRTRGLSAYVLQTGRMVVQDVDLEDPIVNTVHLCQHKFINRNQFKAFISLPIRDPSTHQALGVLFLNYKEPRVFSDQDMELAEGFVAVAALMINSVHTVEVVNSDASEARARGEASMRELRITQQVLDSAVTMTRMDDVILTIINQIPSLLALEPKTLTTHVLVKEWRPTKQPETEEVKLEYVICDYQLCNNRLRKECLSFSSISQIEKYPNRIPIGTTKQRLGWISIKPATGKIENDQRQMLKRFSNTAAQALENVIFRENLENILTAGREVTLPIVLDDTLEAIKKQIPKIASGISAMTLWVVDKETGYARLGAHFGVDNVQKMIQINPPNPDSIVVKVVNAKEEAFFESDVQNKKSFLRNRFVVEEHIRSTAAFSLHAEGEIGGIGAMFFNYRERHEFTNEEQHLFKRFAQIVASSLRDAEHLRAEQKAKEQAEEAKCMVDAALEFSQEAAMITNPDDVVRAGLNHLKKLLKQTIQLCLLVYNKENDSLDFTPASTSHYRITNKIYEHLESLNINDPAISTALARKAIGEKIADEMYIPNVHKNPDYMPLVMETTSEYCISLLGIKKELLGVLVLESPDEDGFNSEEYRKFIKYMAQIIGMSLSRSIEREKLLRLEQIAASTASFFGLAHEFNRNMMIIGGNLDEIIWSHGSDPKIDEPISSIKAAAARLNDLSQTEVTDIGLIEIDDFLDRTLSSLTEEKNLDLVRSLNAKGCCVEASKIGLNRVLNHLINNAHKAITDAKMLPGTIYLSTTRKENVVDILIEDDGPGMSYEDRSIAFNRRNPNKKDGGMGLILCRKDIELMDGNIFLARSQSNRGVSICIRLPLTQEKGDIK